MKARARPGAVGYEGLLLDTLADVSHRQPDIGALLQGSGCDQTNQINRKAASMGIVPDEGKTHIPRRGISNRLQRGLLSRVMAWLKRGWWPKIH